MKYLKRYGIQADTSDYAPDAHDLAYEMTASQDPDLEPRLSEDRQLDHLEMGGQSWINPANYHSAEVGADGEWDGKTWEDMPGTDSENKKLNFVLFRRGLYEWTEDPREAARSSVAHHFRSGASALAVAIIAISSLTASAFASAPQKRDFRVLQPSAKVALERVTFREISAYPRSANVAMSKTSQFTKGAAGETLTLPSGSGFIENTLFPKGK